MIDNPIHKSIKQKLKNISLKTGENFNVLFTKLTLERFVARVEHSKYKNNLVFKGGYCLNNIIKIGRETNDIDFLIKNIKSGLDEIKEIFSNIAEIFVDDGFVFSNVIVSILPINKKYPGYRIELNYIFGSSKNKIHIDIGVGDIVDPILISLNMISNEKGTLFDDQIQVFSYPAETIFSEKLHAAIFMGEVNSRIKDYHDMFLMIESNILKPSYLKETINLTFENRNTTISIIPDFSKETIDKFQKQWKKHLINVDKEIRMKLYDDFSSVILKINQYLLVNKIIQNHA